MVGPLALVGYKVLSQDARHGRYWEGEGVCQAISSLISFYADVAGAVGEVEGGVGPACEHRLESEIDSNGDGLHQEKTEMTYQ